MGTVRMPNKGYEWNPLRKWPRNDACFCKSGKKFKKCCDGKLEHVVTNAKAIELKKAMQFYGK